MPFDNIEHMEFPVKADKLLAVNKRIKQLAEFLDNYLPIANCHMTDFILKGHWDRMIPANIRAELLSLNDIQLATFPNGKLQSSASECKDVTWLPENSTNDSKNETGVDPLNATESPECLVETQPPNCFHSTLEEFVIAARKNTLPLLDILTNVKDLNAETNLVDDDDDQRDTNGKKNNRCMSTKKLHEISIMSKVCARLSKQHDITKVVDIGCGLGYLGCELALNHRLTVLGVDSVKNRTDAADTRTKCLKKQQRGTRKSTKKEASATRTKDHSETNSAETGDETNIRSNVFHTVAHYVYSASDLDNLIQQHFPAIESNDRLLFTGLHTCGDLSADLLHLFLSSSFSQVLCNVGCCYNLMTERFTNKTKHVAEKVLPPSDRGFPMCKVLLDRQYCLGSNSRMLAAQSPDRTAHGSKIPAISLFWRSLLQVILFDMIGEVSDNWCVGKLASKCNSFYEYVQSALKKLNITKTISESAVEEYTSKYQDYCRKIQCFYQLRTCLSPCLEALILLDRLAFLLEQHNIEDGHLVQLFDPVISPRCFAIIGTKHL